MKRLCDKVRFRWIVVFVYAGIFSLLLLSSVGCKGPELASDEELAVFAKAGPIKPQVDIDQLLKAKIPAGLYRVVAGDILELQIPSVLRIVTGDSQRPLDENEPYVCRVSEKGSIALPILGEMFVEGKNLAEIEKMITDAYYPKYAVNLPSVVCTISEYQSERVTVVGAVLEAGVYELRNDEMSLVSALMKAGGIIEDGANVIRIKRAGGFPATKRLGSESNGSVNSKNVSVSDSNINLSFRPLNSDNGNEYRRSIRKSSRPCENREVVLMICFLHLVF